ncbi:MAG: PD-(D/E)XK nuclease family protein [Casimicrobium sp.]
MTAARKSFSNGYQFAWDSTSLGVLKTCPRKYYYQIVLGYQSKAQSVHLRFGIAYHSALEAFEKAQGTFTERFNAALARVVLDCTEPDGSWWESGDSYKNTQTLFCTVIWYLDQFRFSADPATTVISAGKPAVELSFSFNLNTDIVLCGHLDRLVLFHEQTWVLDKKTTKSSLDQRYFAQYNPDNQMTLYTAAAQIILDKPAKGVIIDAAQVLVSGSRFQRAFTTRSAEDIEEFIAETNFFIRQAEFFADKNFWPKNDKSCNNFAGCEFRAVCSTSDRMRQVLLENDFVKRPWDPLERR